MSNTKNQIPLKTAEDWTQRWQQKESTYNKYNECNAFLIPADDLRGVLAEIENQPGTQYVRAYLGVEEDPKTKKDTEKLIIVGTEQAIEGGKIVYKDIINGTIDGKGTAVDDGNGTGLWDFSTPCPPSCDPNSPLNGQ